MAHRSTQTKNRSERAAVWCGRLYGGVLVSVVLFHWPRTCSVNPFSQSGSSLTDEAQNRFGFLFPLPMKTSRWFCPTTGEYMIINKITCKNELALSRRHRQHSSERVSSSSVLSCLELRVFGCQQANESRILQSTFLQVRCNDAQDDLWTVQVSAIAHECVTRQHENNAACGSV